MGKKDELIEKAKGLGIALDSNETVADLEAKIAAHEADQKAAAAGDEDKPEGELKRRRVNRGSRRRIERALASFQKACDEFAKELDLQLFMADEEGERIGQWPLVKDVTRFKDGITAEINGVLTPPKEEPKKD